MPTPAQHGDERPVVTFESCVRATLGGDAIETIEDYFSPVTKTRGLLLNQHSLASLPKYLLVALKKFVAVDGWQPTKLDVSIPLPASFDFAEFVGKGLQPGEEPMVEASDQQQPQADPSLVDAIVAMGFSGPAAEKVFY